MGDNRHQTSKAPKEIRLKASRARNIIAPPMASLSVKHLLIVRDRLFEVVSHTQINIGSSVVFVRH